ncbi:peptidoglycan-binding domain-containing protein [Marinobacter changyiensis]|uniref:peptidoglycan-binding domain-containing protein n=1 Tax=Marinobacter changyiensis TaxID=2604091 RepID=UPI0015D34EAE|nr:peptidoglycan-binding domain-containing protein [Marinobacter changyiensis]
MISGIWRSHKLAMVMTGIVLSAGAAHVSANETVALKNALYGAGYQIKNVNAPMDAATRSALEAFQNDHPDLQATGELNADTKKALGLVTVKFAASQAPATRTASADAAQAPRAKLAETQTEDEIEEDDDGGWSFFN